MGVFLTILVLDALVFGIASGAIWSNKGGSFGAGFALGALLGLIGLIIVAAMTPSAPITNRARAAPQAPSAPPAQVALPVPPSGTTAALAPEGLQRRYAPPPGPGVVRECPHCKEEMRRDAGVCPHCRRESAAWEFGEDARWWATDAAGQRVWLDEQTRSWRPAGENPDPPGAMMDLYDVTIIAVGPKRDAVAKALAETSGENRDVLAALLDQAPTVVLSRVGYATAEGIRAQLSRLGANVEMKQVG